MEISSGLVKIGIFAAGCIFSAGATYGLMTARHSNLESDITEVKTDISNVKAKQLIQGDKISELRDVKDDINTILIVQDEHEDEIHAGKMERNTITSDTRHIKESLMEMTELLRQLLNSQHQHGRTGSSGYRGESEG